MAKEKSAEAPVKEKKTPKKRKPKETLLSALKESSKSLTKEEIKKLYSEIAKGNIKEFTGLPPSIDTRLKAMDKLLGMLEKEEQEENNSKPVEEIKLSFADKSDDERILRLESELFK